jgi:hypothetical protein
MAHVPTQGLNKPPGSQRGSDVPQLMISLAVMSCGPIGLHVPMLIKLLLSLRMPGNAAFNVRSPHFPPWS